MKGQKETENLIKLKDSIVEAMQDKKAEEIVSLDLRKLNNAITDMFIICHASNNKLVEAIAENIQKKVFLDLKEKPSHKEGFENKEWILLDYFNILVHVFLEEKRNFYGLEQLWGDGQMMKY